jgi:heme exporter protein A
VNDGECLAVTGVNGSGKSTLLKIIAGLVRPEAGCVRYCSKRASDSLVRALGYAAPDTHLYAELTGSENVDFFREVRGLNGTETTDALLARVGLSKARGNDRLSTYSSGMRQRLKLAVSLLGEPWLLIWDEPTSALDAAGAGIVEENIERHRDRGGISVIATNDGEEARRWGDLRLDISA